MPKQRSEAKAKAKAVKVERRKPGAGTTSKAVVKKKQHTAESKVQRSANTGTRLLQTPKRYWYRPLTWRHRPAVPAYKPLPKARLLLWRACQQLWQHKRLFGGIALTYGLLNLLLVRGLSGAADVSSVKSTLDSVAQGAGGKALSALASFTYLLASSGSGDAANAGTYQMILLVVCSLAFVWAFRQTLAGHQVRIRDSFYRGMYPLVPLVLLLLLGAVQLLPLAVGGGIYTTVMSNGIAVHTWEKIFWLGLFLVLAWWSLRMITATLFAGYIVTLPDMTPLRAYRSARQLVYGRRLLLWRKLIFLLVVGVLVSALIEIPLILLVTPLAGWVFFVISFVALPIIHAYLYNLYRAML